jgi:hypothetical protein
MSATSTCRTNRETIVALRDGRFDQIAPDRMEAAELHLNECEDCQALLADVTPAGDSLTQAAALVTAPAEREWDAMWDRIDLAASASAADPGRRVLDVDRPIFTGPRGETALTGWGRLPACPAGWKPAPPPPRLLRLVHPGGLLAAAAMVLLMVGLWQGVPAAAGEWKFDLAHADDVEIQSIQVYDDNGVPLVFSTNGGNEDGVSVIWVVEESEGA